MTNDQIEQRFEKLVSQAQEFFQDYLLLVRVPGGGFVSRASDHSWAMGSAQRYCCNIHVDDELELERYRLKQEELEDNK